MALSAPRPLTTRPAAPSASIRHQAVCRALASSNRPRTSPARCSCDDSSCSCKEQAACCASADRSASAHPNAQQGPLHALLMLTGSALATASLCVSLLASPAAAASITLEPPQMFQAPKQLDASAGGLLGRAAPPEATMMPDLSGLTDAEVSTVRIFNQNTPSVVNIANLAPARTSIYSADMTLVPQGTGSGFIWDDKGHIVTNYHVVKGAAELQVTLIDSTSLRAKVLGFDENKDVAVLQLLDIEPEKAKQLKAVTLGNSSSLVVGQSVLAIGNPYGLDHSVTQGIISGVGREIQATAGNRIRGVIQTDAAINPGNSGGVLLNSKGKLIGVNSAILDPSQRGAFSGVGFAIPIDMVKGLVDQILTYGRVIRPTLGITVAPPQMLGRLNLSGVLVMDVNPDSPAAMAVDDKKVADYGDLFEILDSHKPGDKINVDVLRHNLSSSRDPSEMTERVAITLGERSPVSMDG